MIKLIRNYSALHSETVLFAGWVRYTLLPSRISSTVVVIHRKPTTIRRVTTWVNYRKNSRFRVLHSRKNLS